MFDVIFDLIGYVGYVGSVLFVVVVMLYGVGVIGMFFLDGWIENITDGDKCDFIYNKLPTVFYQENPIVYIILFHISTFALLIYTIAINTSPKLEHISWIQGLQNISIKLTPFFSYGVSVVVTLLTINFLAKKGYKLMKAVKTLEDKVE